MIHDDPEITQSTRRAIQRKAEKKYGGITSSWKLTQTIKLMLQKHGVAQYGIIEYGPKGLVYLKWTNNRAVDKVLAVGDGFSELIGELKDVTEACGYVSSYGDDFIQYEAADA